MSRVASFSDGSRTATAYRNMARFAGYGGENR